MEVVLGAATAAVSRAGGSSLAELAAMRVPAVLIPYPAAADNHQFHNARALEAAGAAYLLEQSNATPALLAQLLSELVEKPAAHERMQNALAQWHAAHAAEKIAETILVVAGAGVTKDHGVGRPWAASPDAGTRVGGADPGASRPLPPSRMRRCHTALPAGRGA
jgi:UDP-N-acetylglucosamine--N-acetylmuramyl-(pentapeptide) pyrophosphoryl-undecaprenol N-acetylglucosamine transferase